MVFRVFAASGQFMTRPQKFALGDFLLQAQAGEPIRIRARHPVTRSYVSAESLLTLSWLLLQQPQGAGSLQRFDACTDTLTLQELAQLVELGQITAIEEWVQNLLAEQPECGPFAQQGREAVHRLDLLGLETLLADLAQSASTRL